MSNISNSPKWLLEQIARTKQGAGSIGRFRSYISPLLGEYKPGGLYQPGGMIPSPAYPTTYPTPQNFPPRPLPGTPTFFTLDMIARFRAASARKIVQAVPDCIEVLTGWRAWKLVAGRLASLGVRYVWEPKKMVVAECRVDGGAHIYGIALGQKPCTPCPSLDCVCGIWAFSSLEKLIPAMEPYGSGLILGSVSLWGRVIECEHGFRAQYAYPKELWLLDSSLEQLGYIYGVPIRTIDGL